MKLKAVLLAGAICLAGVLTSSAQTVYSANTVGFVNKEIPAGFSMIANPVFAQDNTISALFDGVPVGSQIFSFEPLAGTFEVFELVDLGGGTILWFPHESKQLIPGGGAFISNPSTAYTLTFSGEVAQGATLNTVGNGSNVEIGAGFSILSSAVAQTGTVESDLGFPGVAGDQIFTFNNATSSYDVFEKVDLGGGTVVWFPSEPTIEVAESFFANKVSATTWTRNFDPNATN